LRQAGPLRRGADEEVVCQGQDHALLALVLCDPSRIGRGHNAIDAGGDALQRPTPRQHLVGVHDEPVVTFRHPGVLFYAAAALTETGGGAPPRRRAPAPVGTVATTTRRQRRRRRHRNRGYGGDSARTDDVPMTYR